MHRFGIAAALLLAACQTTPDAASWQPYAGDGRFAFPGDFDPSKVRDGAEMYAERLNVGPVSMIATYMKDEAKGFPRDVARSQFAKIVRSTGVPADVNDMRRAGAVTLARNETCLSGYRPFGPRRSDKHRAAAVMVIDCRPDTTRNQMLAFVRGVRMK